MAGRRFRPQVFDELLMSSFSKHHDILLEICLLSNNVALHVHHLLHMLLDKRRG